MAARPVFLDLQPGMTVIVRHDPLLGEPNDQDWWMGLVLHCNGGARDPQVFTLFQIADIDSGVVRWVNADLVTHILPAAPTSTH
ncbi:MAG: DUF3104 domain-containing protein [Synechococcus sp. BS301-5m-G53]|uniref:DUF3104 domain-containing protein n=1 Tax=unclassified Synechococcus TaxID=2626047 RepID=UPI00006B0D0E|nr:DUF3104 domain-containing protein [Synechococcus sp. WH 7805]EAR18410.1 hypothetical protein WH7805_01207 [Synechococcus sp. WH 7805]MBL6742681.1 DUF3104 domain-containing protein [Synechococcus sp. BS301-5m-G53]